MRLRFITPDDFRQRWTGFKYPKFMLLGFTFVLAYMLFAGSNFTPIREYFLGLGYVGTFVVGMLYAYGFTAAPATGLLLVIAKQQNIWIAGLIAGVGALLADYIIFKFIRHSFADEIDHIKNERITQYLHSKMPSFAKKYLVPVIGCAVVASPLPDEIGVALLAISTISTKLFVTASYVLNTLGILVVLLIGASL